MSPQDTNVFYGQYHIPAESAQRNETYPRSQVAHPHPPSQWLYNNCTGNYMSTSTYNSYTPTSSQLNLEPEVMTMSYRNNVQTDVGNEVFSNAAPEHHYRALPITTDDLLDQWIVESVDPLGRRSFICRQPNCGVSYPRRNVAYSHIRREHLGEEKTFECIVCGQLFATENTARRHRDNQERRFTCSYCHRAFARQDYYRTHERRCQERFI